MNSGRVGIQIGASTPAGQLAAIVSEAEQLGYGEVWLAEDYFELGGIASAAMALAATEQIPIGLGVVAAAVRHPAVAAMEFASLGSAFPGRLMAGMGHGAPGWVRQMGLQAASPLGLLREAATAVRGLLDGAELTHHGSYFRFDHIRLADPPRQTVPLYFGVHGPASLRLSGELADGTLLGWFSSAGYVAAARERIEEGKDRGGRRDRHQLVALCLLSLSQADPAAARKRLLRFAAPMLAGMADSPQLARAVTGTEPSELIDRVRRGTEEDDAAPGLLAGLAATGDVESCGETISDLLAAGADRVVLVPNPASMRTTEEMVDQMRAAADLAAIGS